MKIKNITSCLVLFFFVCCQLLSAQDRIYFLDQTIKEVRIEKIEGNEITYFEMVDGKEVQRIIYTRKVSSVVFADGTQKVYQRNFEDASLYANQGKQGFKVHLFSPLMGHTTLSYERSIRPGRAMEYSLGIIGLGNKFDRGFIINEEGFQERVYEDQKGVHIGIGYKIYSPPMTRTSGKRYKHLLHGWYMMPKVQAGYYKRHYGNNNSFGGATDRVTEKEFFANLMMYGGKQIVFSESILLDWQVGLGLGWDSDDAESSNHYIVSSVGAVALGGGLRLGFVF